MFYSGESKMSCLEVLELSFVGYRLIVVAIGNEISDKLNKQRAVEKNVSAI